MMANDSSMERTIPRKRINIKRFLSLKHLNRTNNTLNKNDWDIN